MHELRKVFCTIFLCFSIACSNYALTIIKRNIDQKKFQGPCGCIALICASRFSNKEKKIVSLIAKAKKTKENLLSTSVLASIAQNASLNLHCLTLDDGQPIVLGGISWNASEKTLQQARIEKTKRILFNFKYSTNNKFLHFICHLSCGPVDHGFLITIDKRKNILYYYTDQITKYNVSDVNLYIKTLASWYQSV